MSGDVSDVPGQSQHPAGSQGASTGKMLAWAMFDWSNNSFAAVIQTFVFAAYFTTSVAVDQDTGQTQWGIAIGAGGLAVAIFGPLLGAIADQGGRRKPWIGVFSLVGIVATALMWFVRPDVGYVWLALILVAVGTAGVSFANLFYNAMLPGLVPPERVGRWSGWGWSAGYAGGLACLVVALVVFVLPDDPPFGLDADRQEPVRATFLLVAAWYLVFATPMFLFTPDTPHHPRHHPPLPDGRGSSLPRVTSAVRGGFRQLADTVRNLRRYQMIARFLAAKLLYTDGLAALFAFGGVYAAGVFGMSTTDILMYGIALNVTAGLGAFGFAWIDDWIGAKRTILVSLIGLSVSTLGVLVVDSVALFWTFGLIMGIFVGPLQASSRSLLSRAAPPELRGQMFGLYALSEKATAFLAPLAVALVTWLTASQRIGLGVILVYFAAGFLIMLTVPRAEVRNSE